MPLTRRSARRRGAILGAAVASSRANKRAATQQQATQHTPAPAQDTDASIAQLKQLAELKDQGVLTQEEFDAKKKQLLGL